MLSWLFSPNNTNHRTGELVRQQLLAVARPIERCGFHNLAEQSTHEGRAVPSGCPGRQENYVHLYDTSGGSATISSRVPLLCGGADSRRRGPTTDWRAASTTVTACRRSDSPSGSAPMCWTIRAARPGSATRWPGRRFGGASHARLVPLPRACQACISIRRSSALISAEE
jgi:hypothetical protein